MTRHNRGAGFWGCLLVLLCFLAVSSPGWAQDDTGGIPPPDPAEMSTAQIVTELISINERREVSLTERENRLVERETDLVRRESILLERGQTMSGLISYSVSLKDELERAKQALDVWRPVAAFSTLVAGILLILSGFP